MTINGVEYVEKSLLEKAWREKAQALKTVEYVKKVFTVICPFKEDLSQKTVNEIFTPENADSCGFRKDYRTSEILNKLKSLGIEPTEKTKYLEEMTQLRNELVGCKSQIGILKNKIDSGRADAYSKRDIASIKNAINVLQGILCAAEQEEA